MGSAAEELTVLAAEIRDFLVEKVARTGGHLGPNLGVVELTLALHRVFDSPRDRLLFDTGHQAYVHKIVTGRQDGFDQLRQRGGLTGYPNQAESEHDIIENCHASTALSYADGMAKAFALRGEKRHVVAIVGDGALTGGMCWEALNNIAAAKQPARHRRQRQRPLLRADHRRPGRPPRHAAAQPGLREGARPDQGLAGEDAAGRRAALRGAARGQEGHQGRGRAAGPVRGPRHQVRRPGRRPRHRRRWRARCAGPRRFGGPVIVHAVTRKGYGYQPAEDDEADCLHSPSRLRPGDRPRRPRPSA